MSDQFQYGDAKWTPARTAEASKKKQQHMKPLKKNILKVAIIKILVFLEML